VPAADAAPPLPPAARGDVRDELARLATADSLVVASDFDGTLAPIVLLPDDAVASPGGIESLEALARLPRTEAYIVSGRAFEDLAARTGPPRGVTLVGSHGTEWGPGTKLDDAAQARRAGVLALLHDAAKAGPGFLVEEKPFGGSLHYRLAAPEFAEPTVARVVSAAGSMPGVFLQPGKMVVELTVMPTSKGAALSQVLQRTGAAGVFFGDDATDEEAFAALRPGDVGVKVGPGRTHARHRLEGPEDVVQALRFLAAARAAHAATTR
jgi:trehalose 6-phosphate phosphatase